LLVVSFLVIFVTELSLLRLFGMENSNDLLCVQRVKAGDIQAFSMIVSKYGKMVFTVVHKIVENREDAEDITQEIFINFNT
jgi:RNA polymerase sigma-70 factor (ECF subfamily)